MKARNLVVFLGVVFLGLGIFVRRANAEAPPYLVLPSSPSIGYIVPADSPRYAYGWFGVTPRKHWTRHFGYYRDYTQWKWK